MALPLRPVSSEQEPPRLAAAPDVDRVTFVVFSGDMDRLMAAFTMATGAAACGLEVSMFFTFWGTAVLKTRPRWSGKTWVERAFGWLIPGGVPGAKLSRLEMFGLGRWLMVREMRRKGIAPLDELMALARESGVRLAVCETSMTLMGISRDELTDDAAIEICGVAHLWDRAARGHTVFV